MLGNKCTVMFNFHDSRLGFCSVYTPVTQKSPSAYQTCKDDLSWEYMTNVAAIRLKKKKKRPFVVNSACISIPSPVTARQLRVPMDGPRAHNCGVGTVSPSLVPAEPDTLWILSQRSLSWWMMMTRKIKLPCMHRYRQYQDTESPREQAVEGTVEMSSWAASSVLFGIDKAASPQWGSNLRRQRYGGPLLN